MSFMPGGSPGLIFSTSARTAFDRSSGFDTACLITPMLSDDLPLKREITRSSTGADLGRSDVADAHRVAADVGDDDVAELLGRARVGLGDDGEFARRRLDAPRRNLGVLPADRVLDVLHRQLVGGQTRAVEVDAHRDCALAEDAHVGRARQHRQPRLHVALDVVRGLERRQRPGLHGDVDDRVRVRLDLGDDRLVDGVRQLAARPRHLVAHVGRGRIRIALQREADVDAATSPSGSATSSPRRPRCRPANPRAAWSPATRPPRRTRRDRSTETLTTGSSMRGYSRTDSRVYEMRPTSTTISDSTVAKTGRLMQISGSCIAGRAREIRTWAAASAPHPPCRARHWPAR